MKISMHTLVRNEERYVWYAVMSMINHVDSALLWDMSSTDNTFKVLEEIKKKYPDKVNLNQTGNDDSSRFTSLRQEMLEKTKADWIVIVDGDEVWWDDEASKLSSFIHQRGGSYETVVTKYTNLIGDIYHYQDEKASHYSIDGKTGSITIRAFSNKIPNIHYDKPHGTQGIFDGKNVLIQERDPKKRFHTNSLSYLHLTHLPRASSPTEDAKVIKRKMKNKHELGNSLPKDFYYPEVFFRPRPSKVSSVWDKRNSRYTARAVVETIPKKLRRKFLKLPEGY